MGIPIRIKLTLWYSLTMVATLSVFSYVSYNAVERNLYSVIDNTLRTSIDKIHGSIPLGVGNIAEQDRSGSVTLFRIIHKNWVMYESQQWGAVEIVDRLDHNGYITNHITNAGIFRVLTNIYIEDNNENDSIIISVAENINQIESSLQRLLRVFSTGLPFVFLITTSIGYLLAKRSLSPLRDITRKVKYINADRLGQRIKIHNPNDEIGDLGLALNNGFERLDQAFLRLRRFTSDASHELRTPLAVIRSVGELALQTNKSSESKGDSISSILEEVTRLERLVESLLFLARADSGEHTFVIEKINISDLLRDVVECLEILADEKNHTIVVNIETDIFLDVNEEFLQRALFNVLDNAIRYTPRGGDIQVLLLRDGKNVRIEIIDSGLGIPDDKSEKIFERFYRLDDSRSRDAGGTGLGLALARWGVEINGATIVHQQGDNKLGSKFVIRF